MGSFTIPTILRVVADVASMVIGNWRDYNGDGEMRPFGTTVMNPTHRSGSSGFTICSGCGKQYTHLGIGRHWSKCPKYDRCYRHDESLCKCVAECAMKGKRVKL
jgi:hypothetical protein